MENERIATFKPDKHLMNPNSHPFDLMVIGGGTAGLTAVDSAIRLGVQHIALIEKHEKLGGECAYNACVPTKTMLTAARLLKEMRHKASQYGVSATDLKLDFQTLMAKVSDIVNEGAEPFSDSPQVKRFHGEARFVSQNEIQVGENVLTSDKIIVATGSEPVIPPIQNLEEVGFLCFRDATHLKVLPESLLIVGGGPVGIEFSQLFQVLGCQVTLIQKDDVLLPHEEPEISLAIQKVLERDGVRIFLSCDIDSADCHEGNLLSSGKKAKALCTQQAEKHHTFEAEEILVVVGVKPRYDTLALDAAQIQYDPKGIIVDKTLQTSNPYVWAIGDVVGPFQFTHTADYQATIAVKNAFGKAPFSQVDYHAIAWSIYTEPTIAHVGLTEAEARKKWTTVDVVEIQTEAVSRYRIESEPDGFLKLIIHAQTQQILGAHCFASHADDIVHTLVLAVQNQMTVQTVLNMIYIYPTRSQIIQKALEKYQNKKRLDVEK